MPLKLTPRNLALNILRMPDGAPGAFERLLDDAFKRDRSLDGRDRAFAVNLVQGVLRWRLRLDWILGSYIRFPFERMEPEVLTILRIALYQMLFMDRVPASAAVNEAVKQASVLGRPHLKRFVNGILREIGRHPEKWKLPSREKDLILHLSVRYSYPGWIVSKWVEELGAESAESLLNAGNSVSPLVLRAVGGRAGRDRLLESLSAEEIQVGRTEFSPDGLSVSNLQCPVTEIRAFREGLCTVQGEAAQIVSRLLGPVPGEEVLDLCAGLGGKTTHLAELMGDRGFVMALDLNHRRLRDLARTAARMDLHSIRAVAADACGNPAGWIGKRFDRVIVDAPCSALGTVSRHPDVKWCRKEEDVSRLSALQLRLLDSALELLRTGGRLLYATCTISKEENEQVVETFAGKHKNVSLENLKLSAPDWAMPLLDDSGFLRCLPHKQGTEGFFAAMLVKE